MAGGLNLYGFGEGDPVNQTDPFGLCGSCEGALKMLSDLAPALMNTLEVAAVVTMAPVAAGALVEVGTAVATSAVASGIASAATTAVVRVEAAAAAGGTAAFAAGVVEGLGRAAMSDLGNKNLPTAGPAPNKAWTAGRAVGTGLYLGARAVLAHHGITW